MPAYTLGYENPVPRSGVSAVCVRNENRDWALPDTCRVLPASISRANADPHRIRVRKIAELYLIALDIEVDKDTTVSDAHLLAKEVENRLKINIDNIFDILIHIEPLGNIEGDESVGMSKENLNLKTNFKPI